MRIYCLGFLFSACGRYVLLRRKGPNSPPFMRGLWNGVGGKLEPNETAAEAMHREWEEEVAGPAPETWERRGVFSGEGWVVHTFIGQLGLANGLEKCESTDPEEPVMLVDWPATVAYNSIRCLNISNSGSVEEYLAAGLSRAGFPYLVPNLCWLLPMCAPGLGDVYDFRATDRQEGA